METLHIELDKRSYAIYIDRNLLARLPGCWIRQSPGLLLPMKRFMASMENRFWKTGEVTKCMPSFSRGEEAKNLQTVGKVAGQMLDLGLTRRSGILALGGG